MSALRRSWFPVVVLLLLSGCARPAFQTASEGKFPLAERYVRPENVKDFMALYDLHCRGCHGSDGKDGPAPSLNDALFAAIVPEDELYHTIVYGRHDTLMPAFAKAEGGPLTEEQTDVLVQGIRKHWESKRTLPKDLPPYALSEAPEGNKARGAMVFDSACAVCHGTNGKGGMAGRLNDPNLLTLLSDQVLRRIIITGRPDFGMPNFADESVRGPDFKPLTSQDVSDLVALLASWRQTKAKP